MKTKNNPVSTKFKGTQKRKIENDPVPRKLKGSKTVKWKTIQSLQIQGENSTCMQNSKQKFRLPFCIPHYS